MKTYFDTINDVLTLEDGLAHSIYLSLYLPVASVVDRHLETLIRSTVLETLRAHPLTEPDRETHLKVADSLAKQITEGKNPKSVAVYVRLVLGEGRFTTKIVELPVMIDQQSYVGKTLDLRPLFVLEQQSVRALIAKLESKGARLFTLVDGELKTIATIENIWSDFGENENGPGIEKILRRQDSGNQMVLNHLSEALKPLLDSTAKWKQLVFFCNNDYTSILGSWLENELHKISQLQPIVSTDLPVTGAQLVDQAHTLIEGQHQEQMDQLLGRKDEEYHQWATGWKAVTDAVRNRQVDTLLIPPDRGQEGYISHEALPYAEKENHTRPVRNLAPWLAKIVYETNGKVIASKYLAQLISEPLARLRYVP